MKKLSFVCSLFLLYALIQGCNDHSSDTTVHSSLLHVYGIDISHWNGNLNDYTAIDSLSFVICKATDGIHFTDKNFSSNWSMLQSRHLTRGSYHFFRSNESAIQQAAHYLGVLASYPNAGLPAILDVEEGSLYGSPEHLKHVQDSVLKFLNYIHEHTGRIPILYCDVSFANRYFTNPQFSDYPLWLADYTSAESPSIPEAWKSKGYVIWQKSEYYKMDSKSTDLDVYNGSWIDWKIFINTK